MGVDHLMARDLVIGSATPKRERKRKPSLARELKQASNAGLAVACATIEPDGSVSLQFGKPQAEPTNDLDQWMAKHHAN